LALAEEFRVPLEKDTDQYLLLKGLTRALLECARNGQRALVCLDEAQAMPLESLEVLRLLTNLETEKRKLLQVVLFGQPELNERLKHHSIRQLRQRISFQYDLQGLRKNELDRYLRHRLAVAGFTGETLFSSAAVSKLHRITGGTPRLVNIVAHKALMLAFSDGRQQVMARHIRDAAADTPEVRRDWLPWAVTLTGAAVIVSLGIARIMLQ
jgi:MSHA biogenesis protein MshM